MSVERSTHRHWRMSSVTWWTFIELSSHALTTRFTVWIFTIVSQQLAEKERLTHQDDLPQVACTLIQDEVLKWIVSV